MKCGHPLPEECVFLPLLYGSSGRKNRRSRHRDGGKKKALGAAVVLLILAGAGAVFSMSHRPVAYEANAQIVYPDKDHSYKLLLTYSESDGMAGQAQGDRTDLLADGLDSALPCQLYVLNEETGEVALGRICGKSEIL